MRYHFFHLIFLIAFGGTNAAAQAQSTVDRAAVEKLAPAMQRSTEDVNAALKKLLEPKATKLDRSDITSLADQMERTIKVLRSSVKAIYGRDDRRNYGNVDVTDAQRRAADATFALVFDTDLNRNAAGTYDLPSDTANLCTPKQIEDLKLEVLSEPFYDEPAPAFCSGFKIGEDLIATAGHCIKSVADCKRTRFVHRFYVGNGTPPNKGIDGSRIYQCKQVIKTILEQGGNQIDYAIVRTDRAMAGVPSVTLRQGGQSTAGDRLTVVGYPMGLPVKISAGAVVREVKASYLVASLDTYGGNSGSAVFNTDALNSGILQVDGVLVRGEEDFVRQLPCRISKRCEERGCRGEDVTLASEVRKALGP